MNDDATQDPLDTTAEKDFAAYGELVNKWAFQAFLRLFRSQVSLSLGTRLMLTSPTCDAPGGYLRPGIVAKVNSVKFPDDIPSPGLAEEEPTLYFYVTQVIHTISPMNNEASTNLLGSYVRFPTPIEAAGITAEDIENGIKSPLYNSDGSFVEESE
jgi:hypothetical protein